jgi:hypothetical protein
VQPLSPSEVSPINPAQQPTKSEPFFPLVTAKYGYYSFLSNGTVLFLPSVIKYFQNGVPLLADKLHVLLTHFEILEEGVLGKRSKHPSNILLEFLCRVRTVDINFVFLRTLQVKIMRV